MPIGVFVTAADRLRCGGMAALLALAGGVGHGLDLSFETVIEQVGGCRLDMARYRGLWAREDAVLISLPSGGAIRGIIVAQFYMAPGRNGSEGDYGVVFAAPLAQVASTLPDLAGQVHLDGRQRRLVPLVDETGNPRHRNQTLLVCKGGAGI